MPEVDLAVVLDLLDAACTAGASIPGALVAVGSAVEGDRGAALRRVGTQLTLGATWGEAWIGAPGALQAVRETLRPAWEEGSAPADTLRLAAESHRRTGHAAALEAANRLGVRLVVPLGLCYLPAFVLVGLVPVLISMATGVLGA